MGDLWCPLVETMRVYLVKFYKIQTAELNKETSDLHPQTGGGGGRIQGDFTRLTQ